MSAIAISNNGYHIAASHDSASIRFWDLRKQKTLTTLKDLLQSVETVEFDESGKYLAAGGKGGVKVTTVKEWGITTSIETKHPVSGIAWSESVMGICSEKERAVHFYGVSEAD
jgi:WD40 repeat protein